MSSSDCKDNLNFDSLSCISSTGTLQLISKSTLNPPETIAIYIFISSYGAQRAGCTKIKQLKQLNTINH